MSRLLAPVLTAFRKLHGVTGPQLSGSFVAIGILAGALLPTRIAALTLRIAIEEAASEVTIGSSTDATVRDADGRAISRIEGMSGFITTAAYDRVQLDAWQDETLTIEPDAGGLIFINDRWYRGALELKADGYRVLAIDRIDLEEYLYAVLGAEMSASWPLEALKAQAVAARTYALYKKERGRSPDYDLGADTNWQVYRGVEDEADSTRAAVDATRDRILTHNGEPIEAVFRSSAGGHTENAEFVWSSARPYLQGVPSLDEDVPNAQWEVEVSAATMSDIAYNAGWVHSLRLDSLTPGGRVEQLALIGSGRTRTLSGVEMRSALGLPSAKFQVQPYGNGFLISGRGRGHGVGMSQWGARRLAEQGADYEHIVMHYYRNASLMNRADGRFAASGGRP